MYTPEIYCIDYCIAPSNNYTDTAEIEIKIINDKLQYKIHLQSLLNQTKAPIENQNIHPKPISSLNEAEFCLT